MVKQLLFFVLSGFFLMLASCNNELTFTVSTQPLSFSKDTVYLDTVFTNIGSSTYTLKVYNNTSKDIYIPSITLQNGEQSYYRLNVDGLTGKSFSNVELLAKDSLYIFIETTIDIAQLTSTETQFLYTDALQFNHTSLQQTIPLITLVKDAVFLYPEKFSDGTTETITLTAGSQSEVINGFYLTDSELTFTNSKPYVIYGYAAVPEGKTLTIEAGARIHFHENSGILVGKDASLQVNGALSTDLNTLENEVIFEGDRLEPGFTSIPGQWGTIWLSPESKNNTINYTTIKNATVGLLVESSVVSNMQNLTITNSQIYNSAIAGIWSKAATITAQNTVIGNSGQVNVYCSAGGNYEFTHCTIANYWQNGFRDTPALLVTNYLTLSDNSVITGDLNAAFTNCIIYGNNSQEFYLDAIPEQSFNFSFTNNLIKFEQNGDTNNSLLDFTLSNYSNNIFNELPGFKNPQENNFIIGNSSAAINKALLEAAQQVPEDILGNNRTSAPDIGAYQHKDEDF